MPSRRYYITTLPVAHLNGKLDQVSNIVHNTRDPEQLDQPGFWYGYKVRGRDISRFGIRKHARNLNTNPYTSAEEENRTLFTASLLAVQTHRSVASDWSKMLVDFDKQTRYISPIGFAVSETRKNLGIWPAKWS